MDDMLICQSLGFHPARIERAQPAGQVPSSFPFTCPHLSDLQNFEKTTLPRHVVLTTLVHHQSMKSESLAMFPLLDLLCECPSSLLNGTVHRSELILLNPPMVVGGSQFFSYDIPVIAVIKLGSLPCYNAVNVVLIIPTAHLSLVHCRMMFHDGFMKVVEESSARQNWSLINRW